LGDELVSLDSVRPDEDQRTMDEMLHVPHVQEPDMGDTGAHHDLGLPPPPDLMMLNADLLSADWMHEWDTAHH
jgi:hypothetical protein